MNRNSALFTRQATTRNEALISLDILTWRTLRPPHVTLCMLITESTYGPLVAFIHPVLYVDMPMIARNVRIRVATEVQQEAIRAELYDPEWLLSIESEGSQYYIECWNITVLKYDRGARWMEEDDQYIAGLKGFAEIRSNGG